MTCEFAEDFDRLSTDDQVVAACAHLVVAHDEIYPRAPVETNRGSHPSRVISQLPPVARLEHMLEIVERYVKSERAKLANRFLPLRLQRLYDAIGNTPKSAKNLGQSVRPADLSGLDLKHEPWLEKFDLRGADLSGCDFSGVVIEQACLDRTRLRGALVEKTHFIDCSMREIDCIGLRGGDATFTKCNLEDATLSALGPGGALARYGNALGGNILLGGQWIRFEGQFNSDLHRAQFFWCQLTGADLRGSNLWGSRFSECSLDGVRVDGAYGSGAAFEGCHMFGFTTRETDLSHTSFAGCNLDEASLTGCQMSGACFNPRTTSQSTNVRLEPGKGVVSVDSTTSTTVVTSLARARLDKVDLTCAMLVDVDFSDAYLESVTVYGASAWNLVLKGAHQSGLIITPPNEPVATVDDVELAQFIYLLLSSRSVRRVIETLTSRVVLLLGNFGDAGMDFLTKTREMLRRRDYVPVVFDWPRHDKKNLTETVMLLSSMAKFVIVNLTDPRSVPHELRGIIPDSPSLPVLPVIIGGQKPFSMFGDYQDYPWVLPALQAASIDDAVRRVESEGLDLLERKHAEVVRARTTR
jgi:uncharacterized protein YjbI with pentapeptide repeats